MSDLTIDSIIDRAERAAANDKSSFAEMDNNLMNRQSLATDINALLTEARIKAEHDTFTRVYKNRMLNELGTRYYEKYGATLKGTK